MLVLQQADSLRRKWSGYVLVREQEKQQQQQQDLLPLSPSHLRGENCPTAVQFASSSYETLSFSHSYHTGCRGHFIPKIRKEKLQRTFSVSSHAAFNLRFSELSLGVEMLLRVTGLFSQQSPVDIVTSYTPHTSSQSTGYNWRVL